MSYITDEIPESLRDAIAAILSPMSVEDQSQTLEELQPVFALGANSVDELVTFLHRRTLDPEIAGSICWLAGRLFLYRKFSDTEAAVRDISRILSIHRNTGVRAFAAQALGLMTSPLALQTLTTALRNDPSPRVRAVAALSLGEIGSSQQLEALASVLCNQNERPFVRAHAAEALVSLRAPNATPTLLSQLSDPSAQVRFWVAFALGQIAGPEAIPRLEKVAVEDRAFVKGWGSVKSEARDAIRAILGRESA